MQPMWAYRTRKSSFASQF